VALASLTGYGMLGWGPTFLMRVHHMPPGSVGIWFGGATAISLMVGNLLGGVLSDVLGRRDMRAYLWIAGLGPLLSVPFGLLFVFSPTWQGAIVGLFCYQLVLTSQIPTCYAMAQTLAPLRMRATAAVVMTLGNNLVGIGLAPLLIGILNDVLAPHAGAEAVRYSLAATTVGALGAGVAALIGARWVRRDYADTRNEQ